jgi:hypothetical protein
MKNKPKITADIQKELMLFNEFMINVNNFLVFSLSISLPQ